MREIWWYDHIRHTTTNKYVTNGRDWKSQFDDDKKISYKYNLMVTETSAGQLNTYNSIYFKDGDQGNRDK